MATQKSLLALQMMIEDCRFHEKLGESHLGTLYHITHPVFGDCALKYFHGHITADKKLLGKTLQSLEDLKQIEYPNILKVHHWQIGEHSFLIRDLLLGICLQDRIKIDKNLSLAEATKIVLDIAKGLLAGYPSGLVFKNLKPSNIILLPNGSACLVDLLLPPTDPHYLAPEQWLGQKSDIRADIYSLGVIYYQLITGQCPFVAETKQAIREQHLKHSFSLDPFPLDISAHVLEIFAQMLAKSPLQRYHSPLPLITDLTQVLQDLGEKIPSANALQAPELELMPDLPVSDQESEPEPMADVTVTASEQAKPIRGSTGMMMAFTPETVVEPEITDIAEEPTHKMPYSVPLQNSLQEEPSLVEEIYLSRQALLNNTANALQRITHIEVEQNRERALPIRVVHFPMGFEQQIIEHLQQTFRRETWLLKKSDFPEEMEIEINLEQSYVLRHFFYYEDRLQQALNKIIEAQEDFEQYLMEDSEDDALQLNATTRNATTHVYPNSGEIETINDITISSKGFSSQYTNAPHETFSNNPQHFANPDITVTVDFENAYQTMGWVKFVREHNLRKGEHFDSIDGESSAQKFIIHLQKLRNCQKEQQNIARIKEFFQSDYEITELDSGGMGVVLKLIAKNDPTILSLRPENYWAKSRFNPYLRKVKDPQGQEIVYAEIPKGAEFVVKVAFEEHEECLVQEARLLSRVAEDPQVCETIIGSVQQGRLFAMDEKADHMQIGYYLMLEYAPEGNSEQLYRRFPNGRLAPSVAFAIMYGMVQTLQKLEQNGIIHRDIKPANILLDENGVPKLSDFGLAIITTEESDELTSERKRLLRIMDRDFLNISRKIEKIQIQLDNLKQQQNVDIEKIAKLQEELCTWEIREQQRAQKLQGRYRLVSARENAMRGKFAGSLHYAAPEQFETNLVLTPKCDIYQLGAVMFTLLTGKKPAEGQTTMNIISQVLYPEKPKVTDVVASDPIVDALSQLVHKMMAHYPEDRPNAQEINEELEQILFEHVLEIKKAPVYTPPENFASEEQQQRWQSRISFAQKLHQKSAEVIFSTIFKSQPRAALQTSVRKIVFQCPHCGKTLHMYRHMDGKKGSCPGCHQQILVKLASS